MCAHCLNDKKTKLQTVAVAVADVKWIKANAEVAIKGRLFDVKQWHKENDTLILAGVYDEDEEVMLALLENVLPEEEDEEQLNAFSLALLCFPKQDGPTLPQVIYRIFKKDRYGTYYVAGLHNGFKNVLAPPPNMCC